MSISGHAVPVDGKESLLKVICFNPMFRDIFPFLPSPKDVLASLLRGFFIIAVATCRPEIARLVAFGLGLALCARLPMVNFP